MSSRVHIKPDSTCTSSSFARAGLPQLALFHLPVRSTFGAFFKELDLTRRNIQFRPCLWIFHPFALISIHVANVCMAATRLMARVGEAHLYAFNSIRRNTKKYIRHGLNPINIS